MTKHRPLAQQLLIKAFPKRGAIGTARRNPGRAAGAQMLTRTQSTTASVGPFEVQVCSVVAS